jgi:hypothetical protein
MMLPVLGAIGIVHSSFAVEPSFNAPTTVQTQGAAVLRRARHAVANLYAACGQHDWVRLEANLTSDGVVTYGLEAAGTYVAVDAGGLSALCADHTEGLDANANLTDFWVFPTADANTVFIQYRASQDAALHASFKSHLVVVEMRGDRISLLHDLTAMAPPGIALSALNRAVKASVR